MKDPSWRACKVDQLQTTLPRILATRSRPVYLMKIKFTNRMEKSSKRRSWSFMGSENRAQSFLRCLSSARQVFHKVQTKMWEARTQIHTLPPTLSHHRTILLRWSCLLKDNRHKSGMINSSKSKPRSRGSTRLSWVPGTTLIVAYSRLKRTVTMPSLRSERLAKKRKLTPYRPKSSIQFMRSNDKHLKTFKILNCHQP